MDSYSTLLNDVLNNAFLREAIARLEADHPATVNLIAEDWQTRLEHHAIYQHFQKEAGTGFQNAVYSPGVYRYQELNKNLECHLLVASECRLLPPYEGRHDPSIVTVNAPPLEKMARAMFSDVGQSVSLSHEFKFKCLTCSPFGCAGCRTAVEQYQKNGISVKPLKQFCIFNTRIFDGEMFSNVFLSTVADCFPRVFNAILHIKLTSRYDYVDLETKELCYRIGGEVQEVIAFKPNVFQQVTKTLDLGHLTSLPQSPAEGEGSHAHLEPARLPVGEEVWKRQESEAEDEREDALPLCLKRIRCQE